MPDKKVKGGGAEEITGEVIRALRIKTPPKPKKNVNICEWFDHCENGRNCELCVSKSRSYVFVFRIICNHVPLK